MICVRGSGAEPTTAASAGLGVRAFMKAALGLRFLAAGAAAVGVFFAVAMLGSLLDVGCHQRKRHFPPGCWMLMGKNHDSKGGTIFFASIRCTGALVLA